MTVTDGGDQDNGGGKTQSLLGAPFYGQDPELYRTGENKLSTDINCSVCRTSVAM